MSLGYRETDGTWRHPSRRLIFVGDYIDRGPEQVRTLEIVRSVVSMGVGYALMGNHEFNAIAYATRGAAGQFLRQRTTKNNAQHQRFLDEVGCDSSRHHEEIAWMKTLPIRLDLPGLRVVHACWHPQSLASLAPCLAADGSVHPACLLDLMTDGTSANAGADIVLKGVECDLPPAVSFLDKDGHERRTTRLRWWPPHALTYRGAAILDDASIDRLPDTPLPEGALAVDDDLRPVFFGHYWMRGKPTLVSPRHACLDFSVAAGGRLCAYRWDGETTLDPRNLVSVPAAA